MEKRTPSSMSEPFIQHNNNYGRNNTAKDVVYIGLVLSSLLISILSITLSVFSQMNMDQTMGNQAYPLCLPCSSLALSPPKFEDDFQGITRKIVNDGESCCAENSEQFETLMSLALKRKLAEIKQINNTVGCSSRQVANPDCSGNKRAIGAHIVLTSAQTEGNPSNENRPVKGWSHKQNPAFVEGIEFKDNRLLIESSGLYYVYSQLSMIEYFDDKHSDYSPDSTERDSAISHHVGRWNILYPTEESLLKHSQSRSASSREAFAEYVSHLGGVFNLRKGDELYVSVSDLSLVQADTTASYFGMYKL